MLLDWVSGGKKRLLSCFVLLDDNFVAMLLPIWILLSYFVMHSSQRDYHRYVFLQEDWILLLFELFRIHPRSFLGTASSRFCTKFEQ